MFPVYSNGTDMYSPLTHFYVAATCNDFPGLVVRQPRARAAEGFYAAATWTSASASRPTSSPLPRDVPSVMWGQFTIPAGYRTDLKGLIQSSYPMFWEVDR